MRTRRVFTPVLDLMPCRISPSDVTAVVAAAIPANASVPPSHVGAMIDTTGAVSYPLIAGEPTPPTTINC
jgi:hypothetical protein